MSALVYLKAQCSVLYCRPKLAQHISKHLNFLDVRYPKVPNWDNFFQGCVSRLLLTLVGSPPVSNAPNRSDPNSSVDIVPISDNPASANKQQHPIADGKLHYFNSKHGI